MSDPRPNILFVITDLLLDLREDPAELHDRWQDPTFASVRCELLERLYEWRMFSQLKTSDWAPAVR